jgi:hypothetical protein
MMMINVIIKIILRMVVAKQAVIFSGNLLQANSCLAAKLVEAN